MKNVANDNQGMNEMRDKKIDSVLAESERILDKINKRLDNINARQEEIEDMDKALDGLLYFVEWKESKKGVN